MAVRVRRTLALKNTLLGQRLIKAIARAELVEKDPRVAGRFDYSQDPLLFFEHLDLAKTRGFEMLSFDCVEHFEVAEREGEKAWAALPLAEREQVIREWERLASELAPIFPPKAKPEKPPKGQSLVPPPPHHHQPPPPAPTNKTLMESRGVVPSAVEIQRRLG